jgi:hypothetical protein
MSAYHLFKLPPNIIHILQQEKAIAEIADAPPERESTPAIVSGTRSCAICELGFDTLEEQRNHYKSPEHADGIKRKQDAADLSDVSDDSEYDNEQDGDGADNQEELDVHVIKFFNETKTTSFYVYKCILYPPAKIEKYEETKVPSALRLLKLLDNTRTSKPYWTFLLMSGGHFAGCVFNNLNGSKVEVHKTLHKYTVRKKQGGSQRSKDKAKSIKSAGSSIRRQNEKKLDEEVTQLLKSWQKYIDNSSLIWMSAPGFNRQTIHSTRTFEAADQRVRVIPFPPKRPNYDAVLKIYAKLTSVTVSVKDD